MRYILLYLTPKTNIAIYIYFNTMNNYPKIGIRPTIDGRQGGVRESLEEKTMNLAHAVAELI